MGTTVPGMTEIGTDWRVVDGVATAWFDAPSLLEGAALARRIVELSAEIVVDLRATGVRVRLDSDEHAEAVSAAARDLGLAANPAVLQHLSVVFESSNPTVVRRFWQRVLDYAPGEDGGLADPLRRDPSIRIRQSTEPRPLRNRIHPDVLRPARRSSRRIARHPTVRVCHTDPDGNEVDLVRRRGARRQDRTADWQAVFSAMACYRTTSPTQQRDLATAAAALADDTDFPLLVDLRPGLVIIDSGKDQWEDDVHGLELDFADLAGNLQTAARELGATADPGLPRFTQLFLDAADVAAVRAFWVAALGYTHDRRAGVIDIHDPRRLNPVLVFQELDASETERRRQRNRIHFELARRTRTHAPRHDRLAGGRLLDESDAGGSPPRRQRNGDCQWGMSSHSVSPTLGGVFTGIAPSPETRPRPRRWTDTVGGRLRRRCDSTGREQCVGTGSRGFAGRSPHDFHAQPRRVGAGTDRVEQPAGLPFGRSSPLAAGHGHADAGHDRRGHRRQDDRSCGHGDDRNSRDSSNCNGRATATRKSAIGRSVDRDANRRRPVAGVADGGIDSLEVPSLPSPVAQDGPHGDATIPERCPSAVPERSTSREGDGRRPTTRRPWQRGAAGAPITPSAWTCDGPTIRSAARRGSGPSRSID